MFYQGKHLKRMGPYKMKEQTCFNCRYADVYPGTPDVFYLPNGDPGYPGDPPEAMCTDPLASFLKEEYEDLIDIYQHLIRSLFRKEFELEDKGFLKLSASQLCRIENNLNVELDFAIYCPMYEYDRKKDVEYYDSEICKDCECISCQLKR